MQFSWLALVLSASLAVTSDEPSRAEVDARVEALLGADAAAAEAARAWLVMHAEVSQPALRDSFERWESAAEARDPAPAVALLRVFQDMGERAAPSLPFLKTAPRRVLRALESEDSTDSRLLIPLRVIVIPDYEEMALAWLPKARAFHEALVALGSVPAALELVEEPVALDEASILDWSVGRCALPNGEPSLRRAVEYAMSADTTLATWGRELMWVAEEEWATFLAGPLAGGDAVERQRAAFLLGTSGSPGGLSMLLASERLELRRVGVAGWAAATVPVPVERDSAAYAWRAVHLRIAAVERVHRRREATSRAEVLQAASRAWADDDRLMRALAATALGGLDAQGDAVRHALGAGAGREEDEERDEVVAFWKERALTRTRESEAEHAWNAFVAAVAENPEPPVEVVEAEGAAGTQSAELWQRLVATAKSDVVEARALLMGGLLIAADEEWPAGPFCAILSRMAAAAWPEFRARYLTAPGEVGRDAFYADMHPIVLARGDEGLVLCAESLLMERDSDIHEAAEEVLVASGERAILALPQLLGHWLLQDERDPRTRERLREHRFGRRAVAAMGVAALPWLEGSLADAPPLLAEFAAHCILESPHASGELKARARSELSSR